ncbi:DUF948 domain-containing protein [Tessaracoccus oleiagri]|uniref:DUF948 domain-containing protein n=1 Tax=Tessaracoccus oleiagri TaxID=686624 RepID=A0A1G9MAX7_9ACTN|nr:DUF948 domain-containing protein [Tessaracoccus oleiagri]SDL71442.1 protein of unknown function [Tessaracoccus oleiagri]
MSVAELAAMVAAIALCVLVALVAVPLIKLNKTLDEARELLGRVGDRAVPLLDDLRVTVASANAELDRIGTVTEDAGKVAAHAADVSEDAAQFSNLMGAVFRKPLVKTAAFSYGVRKAIQGTRQ